jgi:DinB superfamily
MAEPERPEPDEKDWTWTLLRRCPECNFDAGSTAVPAVPDLVDDVVARFVHRLQATDGITRPAPTSWSPTEYACHIRDVCDRYEQRLQAMLTEDDPLFVNWNQDDTAVQQRYWAQRPEQVSAELAASAARINATIRAIAASQYGRPARRSDGAAFTVETLIQYFAHDLVHHAHDVGA